MRAAASRLAKLRPGSSQTSFSKTRQTLSEYQYAQEKTVWRRYRRLGTFSSVLAFILLIVALTTDYWRLIDESQNTVIGLLIFSAIFGLFASIMTICGLLADSLTTKLYYFHSAGEIFFVCFITSLAAMVTFSVSLPKPSMTSFGFSYVIGWLAVLCYLASAVCLCVDELVRCACASRCCCPAAAEPQPVVKRRPAVKNKPSSSKSTANNSP